MTFDVDWPRLIAIGLICLGIGVVLLREPKR